MNCRPFRFRGGAACAAILVMVTLPAWAERRVALVIGNSTYTTFRSLPNAARDARLIAESLNGLGFETEVLQDAPHAGFEAALARFTQASNGAAVALLFYAGHGLQVGGENYLIPTDATLAEPASLTAEALPLPTVIRAAEGAKLRLIFLDACRDNPLAGQAAESAPTRSLGRGLAPVAASEAGSVSGLGTLISYSTAPGTVALDGAGKNGPFAIALARHMLTPGLEIGQMMRLVRRDVYTTTRGRQVPWDNSSLTTQVVLRPGTPAMAAAAPGAARPSTPSPAASPPPTVSESNGRIGFTAADGRQVTIGGNVRIGPGVRVFGTPVTIDPPGAAPSQSRP